MCWGIVGEDQSQLLAGMLRHVCNHSTQEAEAGGPEVRGHLVNTVSLVSLDFTERLCLQQSKSPKKSQFSLYRHWFVQIMHLRCREVISTGKPLGSKVGCCSERTCLRTSTFFHTFKENYFIRVGVLFAYVSVHQECALPTEVRKDIRFAGTGVTDG